MYMVQRRERIKKQLLQIQWEELKLEAGSLPLEHVSSVGNHTAYVSTYEDRSSPEFESSSDVDTPSLRQTR